MNSFEQRQGLVGYEKALQLSLDNVTALPEETCSAVEALGRIAASEIRAAVNMPSADSSLKDGYAVQSADIRIASHSCPVFLKVVGTCNAGEVTTSEVLPGTAIRILSGGIIPKGADAVLAEEFTLPHVGGLKAIADAHVGRNIVRAGDDIRSGQLLVSPGQVITPSKVGLMVAGGIRGVKVTQLPKVGLLATGDEVILPGRPLTEGKLYASNVALQDARLRALGIKCVIGTSSDLLSQLTEMIDQMISDQDLLITSGGAWMGDRDLVVKALIQLGWNKVFHRVRMGPGKAVGMGLLRGKPVFCLPGGPPSNEMAFLMIALPAISRMSGRRKPLLPKLYGFLTQDLIGQTDWTQFVHCDLKNIEGEYYLTPLEMTRRLSAMSFAKAIVKIPEGVSKLDRLTKVPFHAVDMDD